MTRDLKFEGLILSQDIHVLTGMTTIMEELSIEVDICMLPSRASDLLNKRDIDVLVIDRVKRQDEQDLLSSISRTAARRLTIAAVVDDALNNDFAVQQQAHALIHKPLSAQSKSEFRKFVYPRMIAEQTDH